MIENDPCRRSPDAGTHVIKKKVYGDRYRAFLEIVIAHDPVTDDVDDEEIKGEDRQPERDNPEVIDVQQEETCDGKADDRFQNLEVIEQGRQLCRGDRPEHAEYIHQVDIVYQVWREIKGGFHEVKTQVVVQAHEYPQHKGADQVERNQFHGNDQV